MSPPSAAATVRKLAAVGLLAVFAVAVWPVTASAHTDFESSQPSDGAAVDGPLAEIVVNFTNPARPVGDEFLLLDPLGQLRLPASVDATDGTSFVLTFDPPLTAGTYGLRWEVRAGDAHPAVGSFSFAVIEAAVTTAPSTTAAATTTTVAAPSTTAASTTTIAATAPSTTGSSTSAPPVPPTADASPEGPAFADSGASLAAFLEGGGSGDDGETSGRIGRFLTSLGLIFGLGAFAALVWVIRGDRRELLALVRVMRLTGFAIVAGGLLELAALAASQSRAALDVLDVLDTEAGFAAVLKVAGGLMVFAGFGGRAGRIVTPPQALSAAVGADVATTPAATAREKRWVPAGRAWPGLAGFGAVLVSFWFDGHTVSRGPWALHAAFNSVHLGAAAVWGGGVFAMTTIVWLRRRAAAPTDLGPMIVRFSTPATVSLIAVMAAGLGMAAVILDQPEDLLDSDWGRVLLAKTTAVAIAAGLGAFNHFRLRPAMRRHPDDPSLVRELRVSLTVESVMFVVVLGLTAWLVAAAI